MSRLDWDHNAHYHRLLLRQLPVPCRRAVDIGCGAGTFAAKVATREGHVDAIDRSPAMVETARRTTPGNVSCILGDNLGDILTDRFRTPREADCCSGVTCCCGRSRRQRVVA